MMACEIRVTQLTVLPKGEPTFSEMATTVTLDSEGAGEFVVLEQTAPDMGKVAIDPSEWPALRDAIDRMIAECTKE